MMEIKQLRCKAVFDSNIEKINPLFSKVKIRIAYTGTNRNNSYISKEAFEKAISTIYNCPIIGEFIETVDDFGSHGGKIEISDKGIKYIQTTKPYGVINESSEITWEDIVEEDGSINTYLCATGYLWTGRYEELFSVIENSKGQSMEIEVTNGEFKNINNQQVYAVEDFIFSAFCILGDTVEPCFESSNVTAYNFNKNEFKEEFNKMLNELKEFSKTQSSTLEVDINKEEGGKSLVNEKLELLKKYNLTVESFSFNIEEMTLEEIENKIKEDFQNNKSEEIESKTFSITYRQKRDALSNALDPKIEKDSDGNLIYEEYMWVEDFDDSYVFVEKSIWTSDNYERKYGRLTYTFNEETIIATITGEFEEMVVVWLTIEENKKLQDDRNSLETMSLKISKYESEITILKTTNEELSTYKNNKEKEIHTNKVNEIFAKFEDSLSDNQDYIDYKKSVSKDVMNYSIEVIEDKLSAIFGKLQFSKVKKPKNEKVSALVIENSDSEIEVKPLRYGKYEKLIKSKQ